MRCLRPMQVQYFARTLMAAVLAWPLWCLAEPAPLDEADAAYVQRFEERFKPVEPVPSVETYATAANYDGRFLGDALDSALEDVQNDQGGLA
jgi:hypothetical protein